jgi:hypothetical protein
MRGFVVDEDQEREQGEVMGILEPYFVAITSIYENAVHLYNQDTTPRARAEHDSRAALSAIYRHAWIGYQRELGDQPGFHFRTVNGLHILNIRDQVVLRAKRVDANGFHVNNQTRQQQMFDRQQPIPGLPPEAVRIVVGYQLDLAFSTVERVIVRSPGSQWAAQVVALDEAYVWEDITPAQLPFPPGRRSAG